MNRFHPTGYLAAALALMFWLPHMALAQTAPPALDPSRVQRPATVAAIATEASHETIARGERLFSDARIGKSGESCTTCHGGFNTFSAGFAAPFPHRVGLVQRKAGIERIDLDEMIQFCLVSALLTDPLPWGSPDLAALVAYTAKYQKEFAAALASGRIQRPPPR